ncbi:MAG: long-chain fatty acid--CoA ligase [Calditrichaeota bacterium]|nr:MAG: long-chain fatty acid--CoA ligase [Calditrichota bacterium]
MKIFDSITKNALVDFMRRKIRRFGKSAQQNVDIFAQKIWLIHYDPEVPHEIPEINQTLIDIFNRSVIHNPEKTAIVYFGRKFSYHQLKDLVQQVAAGMHSRGVRKNDRIALLLPNLPQFVIAYWAVLSLGAVVVPLNPLSSCREVDTFLAVSRPRMMLTLDIFYDRLEPAFRKYPDIFVVLTSIDSYMPKMARFIYLIKSGFTKQGLQANNEKVISFDSLFQRSSYPSAKIFYDDTAVLLFTGGVTGVPKAVQLKHKGLVANTLQTFLWLGKTDADTVVLGFLPLFHSYGMTACHHLSIQMGSTLILEPRFKAARAIDCLKKYPRTVFPGVPTMYRAVLNLLQKRKRRLNCFSICVSGGAPLPDDLKMDFEKWTTALMIEGYGLTEASPITHCNPLHKTDKRASIGIPLPGTEARIIDLESKKLQSVDQIGELQIRGPQVMAGYWGNQVESKMVLSEDGWLSTGDLAKMDQDGFFYIVDRKKDLILYGGLNVYPSEVEQVLNEHPLVDESAVVGLPNEYYGEIVKAFVKLKKRESITAELLIDFCQERLSGYKCPKQIEFVEHLPKSFIGKILRRNLIQLNKLAV